MITRAQVVECARTYLGTPFGHQGRLKGKRIDCCGLLIQVGKELAISNWDIDGYNNQPDGRTVVELMTKHPALKRKSLKYIKPGDILCFRDEWPCHMAYVGDGQGYLTLIHAYAPMRKVVEHILDEHWKKRVVLTFEIAGIDG